ncbi:MAG: type I-U CRISPR-associated protein Cas7 [Chloroflexi bacterium]|nr:type I-U CRISPR-associated protein Cas7 [Rhodospirillales bacterium]MYE31616.1 type I-U CRISPR-associated protein Cas7 [Chloroflexota bacterium]
MPVTIDLERLLPACADDSFDDGIRIDGDLHPLAGPGGPVKPAVYEGGAYQLDRRWASPDDAEPTLVIVIDNVPSQANRLEHALRRDREASSIPEFVLDLSELGDLPAHLPRTLSSLEFPHRNADAYLRDAKVGDDDFIKTDVGRAIFGATAQECGPLMSWFPQALLYGFWQSHLGRKRHNTKHARAWVSEIIGWQPASTETRVLGLKGDPLNLNTDEPVNSDPDDRTVWGIGGERVEGGRSDRLSELGHGQVPFMDEDTAAASAVSFPRVTQRATVSFAQLRRVSLGRHASREADAAARALLVALGLHAHQLAFGHAFALRSGADLRPAATTAMWLGSAGDETCDIGGAEATRDLLAGARTHAESVGVPLDGWGQPPMVLRPGDALARAIRSTWPVLED